MIPVAGAATQPQYLSQLPGQLPPGVPQPSSQSTSTLSQHPQLQTYLPPGGSAQAPNQAAAQLAHEGIGLLPDQATRQLPKQAGPGFAAALAPGVAQQQASQAAAPGHAAADISQQV